ncbi:hypothetical protein T4D_16815 [Trichinella pseudospiralis]|uniref:Uncharacterized protein n=1 Tax=Trichinella pseudospiralis TaxID=6337 RepID=A0A0V1FTW2_TRIPS|nr:hypothetical protein T4D_16815 [Trichinella pseudospiralis]
MIVKEAPESTCIGMTTLFSETRTSGNGKVAITSSGAIRWLILYSSSSTAIELVACRLGFAAPFFTVDCDFVLQTRSMWPKRLQKLQLTFLKRQVFCACAPPHL